MHRLKIDRRASVPAASVGTDLPGTTRIVRQALLVQAYFGSVGAIEYLKAHDVDAEVIARVLSGERLREDDRELLAQPDAQPAMPSADQNLKLARA
jgi:hypothetical protein